MARADDERFGSRAAVGLGALVLATFVAVTTELAPVGLLPQLSRAFSVSEGTTGLLVTVYAALVAVLAVPLTRVTAQLPRKPLLLTTIALYVVGNLLITVAPTFAILCAGRVVGGIAHAVFFSLWATYAMALVPPRVQGRAIAVVASGVSIGTVLGVPLATSLGSAADWRTAFAALAAGGVATAIVAAVVLPPVPVVPAPTGDARGPARALVGAAVVNVLAFLGQYTLYTYVSTLLIGAGVAVPAIGAVLLLLGVTGVLGLRLGGLVIDRRPRAGLAVALVVAAVCVASLLVLRTSTAGTITAASVWAVGFGAIPIFCAAACIRTRALSPDLAAAVNNAASNVGIGGGAAVGGLLFAASGLPTVISVAAVCFVAAAALTLVLRSAFPSTVQVPD